VSPPVRQPSTGGLTPNARERSLTAACDRPAVNDRPTLAKAG
jgi:hypothetical protein